jgi:protease-4
MKKPVIIILVVGAVMFALLIGLMMASLLFLGGDMTPSIASGDVGLVEIDGIIMDSEDVLKQLKGYSENDSIKAIVIRINSPGGAVVPSQEIYEEVKRLRDEEGKVIVASMGSVAASGGYYIAAGADTIMASPGTLTGSIGVIMEFATGKELMDKIGIKNEVVKSGNMKDVGNFMRDMTDDERGYLQYVIDDVHEQFVEAVAGGRHMDRVDVAGLANGSIYTGRQALELGLVDKLGGLDDAVTLAGEMAGIKGEPKVVRRKKKHGLLELMQGEDPKSILREAFGLGVPKLMYLCTISG